MLQAGGGYAACAGCFANSPRNYYCYHHTFYGLETLSVVVKPVGHVEKLWRPELQHPPCSFNGDPREIVHLSTKTARPKQKMLDSASLVSTTIIPVVSAATTQSGRILRYIPISWIQHMINPHHDTERNVGSLLHDIGGFSPRTSVSTLRVSVAVLTGKRVLRNLSKAFYAP
jgi:hypothetical protein